MKKIEEGMTLLEIIIVFSLLATLAVSALFLIRPEEQFSKAKDTHRKNDLNEMRKIFESWMGDKGCYPKVSDVCYNSSGTSSFCNICSTHAGSPTFAAYTTSVLCDPDSPLRDYLYEAQGDINCPTAFVIYSKLTSSYDSQNDLYKCTKFHGCGQPPNYGYDYVVTSPNAAISVVSNYYCWTNTNRCQSCGSYASCQSALNRGVCRTIYGSKTYCCADHPRAGYCP